MGTIPCPGRRSAAFLPVTIPEEPHRALSLPKTHPWEQSFQVNCGQLPMIIIQHLKKIGAVKVLLRVTNSKSNDTIGF